MAYFTGQVIHVLNVLTAKLDNLTFYFKVSDFIEPTVLIAAMHIFKWKLHTYKISTLIVAKILWNTGDAVYKLKMIDLAIDDTDFPPLQLFGQKSLFFFVYVQVRLIVQGL